MDTTELVKQLLLRAGANWVLYVLFALLVVSIGIYVERLLALGTRQRDVRALAAVLDAHLAKNDFAGAIEALRAEPSVASEVATTGLRLAPRGAKSATHGMESATATARKELESRLSILATIGTNAPFIGLFGTVIGVILAFEALSHGRATGGAALVMAAIAEALVATAVGISVALPAVAMHNHLQRRVTTLLDDAEAVSRLVVAYLVAEPEA